MNIHQQLLIIFIKNPELGKVKTRLAKTMGEKKALEIYKSLLNHTHAITKELHTDKAVFYSDFVDHSDQWEDDIYLKKTQRGSNLGDRMFNAFAWGFEQGYSSICIIGSDCYEITTACIESAFQKLLKAEVAIGPSFDGGYYLLAMKSFYPFLFKNKRWSTGTVFEDTIKDIESHKIATSLLEVLHDVDVESDLKISATINH